MKYYLNLTNGIEFLEKGIKNVGFIRIQSTYCEQKLWDYIIRDLDYQFLLDLALGVPICVCDTSAHKKESRAIYQGIKFIEYTLNRIWFNKEIEVKVNGINSTSYFRESFKTLCPVTINKIKYVKKFLNTKEININTDCFITDNDGKYEYYKNTLINYYEGD